MKTDRIFSTEQSVSDFKFDDAVADVFPDMIARSVPGYGQMLSMIELLAGRFVVAKSNIYDLGCSLGAGTLRIRNQTPASCTIHAVDNSAAMISRFNETLQSEPTRDDLATPRAAINLQQADIRDVAIEQASFVALNLTLQFLPVADRTDLLERIFGGMLPGAALLLSEKICFGNPAHQELLSDLHHDFKRANGYSDLEIAQKRTALENTLITETLDAHCDRLRGCGYGTVTPWLQCFNFVSILAIKDLA